METDVWANLGMILAICVELLTLLSIAGMITHVIYMVDLIVDGIGNQTNEILFLVAGVLIPPIGIIHGWMIWFGNGLFL
jgi:hypothetical protein